MVFGPPSRSVATHTTFKGETIAYAYDSLNRLVTKTLPGDNAVPRPSVR
ncbi:MAG: hypothetical protein IH608_07370 [Proteobacteria bacterium]|nr:hypothetical protein [Pseudomonadota bacterium]